ncbi:MAG TPA: Gfo/Idh/MocA family oxidoreductase [Bryobacterales bacterium]|nr:Gfo/Idh/MocA family oxidoreductase [Bryobacterales bacterium]
METTRRSFTVAGAAALTALSYQRVLGANDRARLGFIGVGNRGDQDLRAFLEYADQQVAAVCDLREDYMEHAAARAGTNPQRFKDYRRLLEMRDLDAVVIATPDHWHALMCVDACNAGKDVYVEKPMSLTVVEGRKMVEAVTRNRRVAQVGINRRSSKICGEAAELVRSGGIGRVTAARCWDITNEWPQGIGNPPDAPPPKDLDWDLYLGPAPRDPFNPNRTFYRFRWFWHYSGGQITNNGVHYLDLIQWALGHDAPLSVTAVGGKYAIADNREIPDTMEALWEYPGKTLVTFSQFNCNGAPAGANPRSLAEFRGTKGTMYVYDGHYEVVPEENAGEPIPAANPLDRTTGKMYNASKKPAMEPISAKGPSNSTVAHARNFLDCIKSRAKCNCDIETGHRSTTTTILGNLALKTESHLKWDRDAERFTNNEAANRLLSYRYRPPWKLA